MAFKIYTKTGDLGETGLFGGKRLPKHHLRIDAYGTVDELNAFLGLLRDQLTETEEAARALLYDIQNRLFALGANLASDPDKKMAVPGISEENIAALEQAIDGMEADLPQLKNFILPGGHVAVSTCHVARCVCRRAERLVVALAASSLVEPILIRYLNRLSDYLFVLARWIGHQRGVEEVLWQG
ncbi:MAG TPA: cob(I)yrinic acid a,c-diamide adenosyltransferase [Saprospiraceae bacterium]|nr:cob(I)yrinic acid a,c-diamide adenosyltransferase [Saprospiraceae bacterium]HMQ83542.1 cob(I)yrinic acid a,c-diamide adenosyltransferase [Saprospiraceae bacterium]